MPLNIDGTCHIYPEFHALNKLKVRDNFPICTIDDILNELNNAHVLTRLDLYSRYNQILMKEVDILKIDFDTHEGHYKFFFMPLGLCNAPSIFEILMNNI